jgi:hypothetical protein
MVVIVYIIDYMGLRFEYISTTVLALATSVCARRQLACVPRLISRKNTQNGEYLPGGH